METIEGYVDHIIYRNEGNGYTVLALAVEKEQAGKGGRTKVVTENVTCTGSLPAVSEGEILVAEGSYSLHASYGEQFKVTAYETKAPTDAIAMERYLGSGAIKGVGAALAGRIVRRFKGDTFRIIEEEPERLAEIKGISEKKAREIAAQMEEKRGVRDAFVFLSQYGISNTLAVKIYQQYKDRLYGIIRENPYRMADDITGVGFKIADDIARKSGISVDSDFRIRSGIFYVLNQAAGEGHLFLPADVLHRRAGQLLGIDIEDLRPYLTDLAIEHKVVVKEEDEQTKVYAASLYYTELNAARMLCDLNLAERVNEEEVLKRVRQIEREQETVLDEMQRLAVLEAARSGLLILTGGPGTGKTTTINTMIAYFDSRGMDIALAAPTGRAAKRMTEATGYEAKTIHRLLEVEGGPEGGTAVFGRDKDTPLEYDVVIIDEMSMVDIFLMHSLLNAVTPGTKLIMVGDASQLPSVGPGCVLRDMIDSDGIKVVRLNRIFRQAQQSDIVVNAHLINRGEHVRLDNKSRDFFFLKRDDANVIISIAIQLIREKLPGYVNAEPLDIQVLTPTRKGLLGVERLNRILQRYLNPPAGGKAEYTARDKTFRVGDKVMQVKNNYQLEWEILGRHGFVAERGMGIFNGDIGSVKAIDEQGQDLTIVFDEGRQVRYPFSLLDELELAYAVTIHKSQGSEYPAVIIPLLGGPRMLLNRNLLYTAVTRAKSCVVLVGDPGVFEEMIDNVSQQRRYTSLRRRIRELGQGEHEGNAE